MDDTIIEAKSISKDFKLIQHRSSTLKGVFAGLLRPEPNNKDSHTQHALKDISFEIKKGEFFGIVGRNGSGKSTLLKMLAGIYQPNKGKIHIQGKLVPFIELGVGFNPELTGRENVYLNGALLGFTKKQIDDQYESIVEFAELEKFMDQKLKNYSSGMQVRLAFSMAIRARADILLIDEVLAVGDADFQRKCFDYFREIKKSKITVVFVSHDMNAVREYCDRALLIDKSKIVKIGSPEEIGKMYTKLFMNLAEKDSGSTKTKRIGDQQVSIDEVKLSKNVLKTPADKNIVLSAKISAKQNTEDRISVGFLIKNSANASIVGINTHGQHQDIGTMKKGDTLTVEWKIPNIFSDGKYLVDVAITSTDGTINHDWWEEVTKFRAYREEQSPYLITPTIPVTINKASK
jgi:ABC-2 type transport system ATP-binding protein